MLASNGMALAKPFPRMDKGKWKMESSGNMHRASHSTASTIHFHMNDLKFAFRQLLKSPGFTSVVLLTLALCIGANSAIFSTVNAVLLKPFPYPDSERLVYVNNSYPGNDLVKAGVSIPDYLDRVEQAPSIEAAMLYTFESFNLAGDDQPTRVMGLRVTPSMFETLQVSPRLGRPFTAAEAQPGKERVVLLSHSLWKDRFAGREEIVGETVRLHGISHIVGGVMPESFRFPQSNVQLWVPYAFTPEQRSDQERGIEYSTMLTRLKPGATRGQLKRECDTIIDRILERLPDARSFLESTRFTVVVSPMLEATVADVADTLWLLQAGVAAALLIGCANVANLTLARVIAREREFAIRAALGAGRWRMVRQLGVEAGLLFLIGGILGWFAAVWGLSAAAAFGLADLPRSEGVRLDGSVFVFTLATVGLTGLFFGLLPALHASRVDANESLRDAGTRASLGPSQARMRHGLVVAEMALAVMLLTTAGLLYHSFERLQRQDPGFDHASTLTARLTLPPAKYPTDESRTAFAARVMAELKSVPGVSEVGLVDAVPFGFTNPSGTYNIVGREPVDGAPPPHAFVRSVSSGYFASMGIPLLRGRGFTEQDGAESDPVVVIDRVLADRYFKDADPVGQQIARGANGQDTRRIVGVVAPVKHGGLDDPATKETLYFPYHQRPVETFTLVARATVPAEQLMGAVRRSVLRIDPEQPLFDLQTLAGRIEGTLLQRKIPMRLLGVFGGMALLLAALGVYGVLAFNVGQRRREFGIRTALGATAGDISNMVVGQGIRLVALGIVLGLLSYAAVSHFLRSLVFDVSPLDPISLLVGPAALLVVAALACWVPARRAARVDPMEALRAE
jgi:putative ABC transport system permease protein